eukprot:6490044-Amphidinium_carterae.1
MMQKYAQFVARGVVADDQIFCMLLASMCQHVHEGRNVINMKIISRLLPNAPTKKAYYTSFTTTEYSLAACLTIPPHPHALPTNQVRMSLEGELPKGIKGRSFHMLKGYDCLTP